MIFSFFWYYELYFKIILVSLKPFPSISLLQKCYVNLRLFFFLSFLFRFANFIETGNHYTDEELLEYNSDDFEDYNLDDDRSYTNNVYVD